MLLDFLLNLLLFFGLLTNNQDSSSSVLIIKQEELVLDEGFSADKAAVFSDDDRVFLYLKNEEEVQAIASITKLMTAIVFLETKVDLETIYRIKADDRVEGGKIHLFLGDELTLKDLFLTSLVASDNGATIALVRASGLPESEFVSKMNLKAREMGLFKTNFFDPIGLSEKNTSTAREVILLFKEALKYQEIVEAISLSEYRFNTVQGREKVIESTDQFLLKENNEELTALGGKTGYIPEAGFCFVGVFSDSRGNKFYATVLNSIDRNSRFLETKSLVNSLRK